MTPSLHPEPRSAVIFRHTQDAIHNSKLCLRKLATRIAEQYMAEVPQSRRIVAFHVGTTTESLVKAESANAQLISRFFSGVVKLPADLEEAWVASLPEAIARECRRELVRRHGFLAAETPTAQAGSEVTSIGELAREFGETMTALAPVLADGRIDGADAQHLKHALKESADLMAALVTLQTQLAAALPELPTLQVLAGGRRGARG